MPVRPTGARIQPPSRRRFAIAKRLLAWYGHNARSLPWRKTSDPYRILVSEFMLQQTRVQTVLPYYRRWLRRFPDIRSLACASDQAVLREWEGLGYYRRARQLRDAARLIVHEHGGQVPDRLEDLLRIPGVGPYTAGAVASIVFGQAVPAIDGNVRRVFARLFDVATDIESPASLRRLRSLIIDQLPADRAGDFNQALMDLASQVCTPRRPSCSACPLNTCCQSFRKGTQDSRPVRAAARRIPQYAYVAAVIVKGGKCLLARRPEGGLLAGLWEFPQVRIAGARVRAGSAFRRQYGISARRPVFIASLRHAYSHFRVKVRAYRFETEEIAGRPGVRWFGFRSLHRLPMGKVDRMIAERIAPRKGRQ